MVQGMIPRLPLRANQRVNGPCCRDPASRYLRQKVVGWGTWIRTRTNGVRVRGSTVNLFPKNSAAACVARCARLIAKARADANTLFEKVCALTERALRMAIVRWKARAAEKAIGETAARCYLPLNETDGRLLHARDGVARRDG